MHVASYAAGLAYNARGFSFYIEGNCMCHGGSELPPDWLGSGFVGVVILQALHLFPILYLNLTAALANIDPALGQAARNLGASRLRTFLHVTFPLLMPGLFAGGTIVFIWAFTDIGTPIIVTVGRARSRCRTSLSLVAQRERAATGRRL